jgi:hypothetical protein
MIGGKEVSVPQLTFWCQEVLDPQLSAIAQTLPTREFSDHVLRIIATSIEANKAGEDADPELEAIEKTFMRFKRKIIFGEMRQLSAKVNELLANSGWDMSPPGEAQATSPEDQTSTDSSRPSLSETSAAETQSESNAS